MTMTARAAALLFSSFVLFAPALDSTPAAAQGLSYVKAHYTKYEHLIPMRDGVKLFTAVYAPKDTSKVHPILLNRTPYSVAPYGADNYRDQLGPSDLFAREKYIFVYQDVRGRSMSEGEFVNVRPHRPTKKARTDIDESTDTWDTIDWLVKRVAGNNGRVGMWGISYPGFYAAAGMIDAHPALRAVSPQAPIADWFIGDDFHHNGALFLPHVFNFFASFGRPRPEPTTRRPEVFDHGTADGYDFFLRLGPLAEANARHFKNEVAFWNEVMEHDRYDAFWQARNLRPHLKGIRPAVLTVGGWFDAEDLFGALETYRAVERNGPKGSNILVMGPWVHGGWARGPGDGLGAVRFDAPTSEHYREKIELPFFEHHLRGKSDPKLPEATVFETGRNVWRSHAVWPPRNATPKTLYFHEGGRLRFDPAAEVGFDEYMSDPARPVPFIEDVAIGMTKEYMIADQRFASRRPDVLVYQTDVLSEDVTLAGPLNAHLQVATTGTDADFVVKLIDVYPPTFPDPAPLLPSTPAAGARAAGPPSASDAAAAQAPARRDPSYSRMGGYQQLVRGEPMRGRFRKSFERPEAFVPGEITNVDLTMPDVYHSFRRGHRIMVQVQSSWFPLVNVNPQTFTRISTAAPADYRKAAHRVYRGRPQGSHLRVLAAP